MKTMKMVKRVSPLGISLICPDRWISSADGEFWYLKDPNDSIVVNIYVCTVEGTGSPSDFRNMVTHVFLKDHDANLEEWAPFTFVDRKKQQHFFLNESGQRAEAHCEDQEGGRGWIFFTANDQKYYYAMVISTCPDLVFLNGGFYDEIAPTFCGLSPSK
jgi:hypothetical protein